MPTLMADWMISLMINCLALPYPPCPDGLNPWEPEQDRRYVSQDMNMVWKRQVALHVTLRAFLRKLTSRDNVPRDTEQTITPGVHISSVSIYISTTWLLPLGHSCWETCWTMPSIYYLGFTWASSPAFTKLAMMPALPEHFLYHPAGRWCLQ